VSQMLDWALQVFCIVSRSSRCELLVAVTEKSSQMLVYENYNKFISATDTIRSMKSNVDGMDATMQELRSRLGAPQNQRPVIGCDPNCSHTVLIGLRHLSVIVSRRLRTIHRRRLEGPLPMQVG